MAGRTVSGPPAAGAAGRAVRYAAEQGQGLGQFGMFLLQLVVVRRGLIEHALQFIDAALSIFGLLPQLGVAAKQVFEQLRAITSIRAGLVR